MAVPKESKAEDLLEGSNTENVESDSQTSLTGEEIPEALEAEGAEIDDDLLADDVPTPSEPVEETQEAPVEAGTPEPTLSPMEQMFKDKGLDKQFSSVEDMMSRVPEMNKHIDNLSVERKQLRELKEQAPPVIPEPEKAPSSDDFYNDPVNVINSMVEKKVGDFNRRFDEMEANTFISSKSDYTEMEPMMEEQLTQNPGLQTLGIKALPILYQMAKAKQLSEVQPATIPVPNKESAVASVGKKFAPTVKDKAYWNSRSRKQIEEELGVESQYKD